MPGNHIDATIELLDLLPDRPLEARIAIEGAMPLMLLRSPGGRVPDIPRSGLTSLDTEITTLIDSTYINT
jgi:hypothetical protein